MGSGIVSPGHMAILLVVVLLVFGAKRLPEMGRSLGHGLREFKDSVSGEGSDDPAPAELSKAREIPAAHGEFAHAQPDERAEVVAAEGTPRDHQHDAAMRTSA